VLLGVVALIIVLVIRKRAVQYQRMSSSTMSEGCQSVAADIADLALIRFLAWIEPESLEAIAPTGWCNALGCQLCGFLIFFAESATLESTDILLDQITSSSTSCGPDGDIEWED
jgi:hypothetical protein